MFRRRRYSVAIAIVSGGLVLIAVGLALLSLTTVNDTYLDALPWFGLIGIGVGLTMAPATESVMGSLPKEGAGAGSATSDTSMQIGGALGVGILGTVLNTRYRGFMTPQFSHLQVPAGINALILGSAGGAQASGSDPNDSPGVPSHRLRIRRPT